MDNNYNVRALKNLIFILDKNCSQKIKAEEFNESILNDYVRNDMSLCSHPPTKEEQNLIEVLLIKAALLFFDESFYLDVACDERLSRLFFNLSYCYLGVPRSEDSRIFYSATRNSIFDNQPYEFQKILSIQEEVSFERAKLLFHELLLEDIEKIKKEVAENKESTVCLHNLPTLNYLSGKFSELQYRIFSNHPKWSLLNNEAVYPAEIVVENLKKLSGPLFLYCEPVSKYSDNISLDDVWYVDKNNVLNLITPSDFKNRSEGLTFFKNLLKSTIKSAGALDFNIVGKIPPAQVSSYKKYTTKYFKKMNIMIKQISRADAASESNPSPVYTFKNPNPLVYIKEITSK